MYLRRLPTGSLLAAFRGFDSRAMRMKFDPSGRRLVSGHFDGSIRIWDAECKADTAEGNVSTHRLVRLSKRI
jgi:WD40 repeat protein